jgi:hypothetical protein
MKIRSSLILGVCPKIIPTFSLDGRGGSAARLENKATVPRILTYSLFHIFPTPSRQVGLWITSMHLSTMVDKSPGARVMARCK